MATNAKTFADKQSLTPNYASGNFRTAVVTVDYAAQTLFATGDTDNVTIMDIPKGTIILGVMSEMIIPATNGGGTCTGKIIAGGAGGTALEAANDMKAAAATVYGGAMTANAYVATAATTLVAQFATATAPNTVNPKVKYTVFFAA